MDFRESTTVRSHLATKSIDIPANDGLSVCSEHVVRREFHKVVVCVLRERRRDRLKEEEGPAVSHDLCFSRVSPRTHGAYQRFLRCRPFHSLAFASIKSCDPNFFRGCAIFPRTGPQVSSARHDVGGPTEVSDRRYSAVPAEHRMERSMARSIIDFPCRGYNDCTNDKEPCQFSDYVISRSTTLGIFL